MTSVFAPAGRAPFAATVIKVSASTVMTRSLARPAWRWPASSTTIISTSAGAWVYSSTRATRPRPSAAWNGTWAMAWARGCVRRPAPCSWTWHTGSASATCACIFHWGSRFEAFACRVSPPAGVVAARAHYAGGVVVRLRRVADGHAGGHAHVAHDGRAAVRRACRTDHRQRAGRPERG